MKKILFTLAASATLFSNALLAADEEIFISPSMVTTSGVTGHITPTAMGIFCKIKGYSDYKDYDILSVFDQENYLYMAIPTDESSTTTPWTAYTGPEMYYPDKVTCYNPPAVDRVFNSPKITVSGHTVPIAEKAQLNGWQLDSFVLACSDKGYAPVSQSLTSLSVGLYAEYDIFSPSGGWTLRFKPDDGTTISIISSMTCHG